MKNPTPPTRHPHRKPPARPKTARPIQPPMTPMIDVTFQLLIFFLLTTTFRVQEGSLPGALPKGPIGLGFDASLSVNVRPGAGNGVRYELQGTPTAITAPGELHALLASRLRAIGGAEHVNVTIRVQGQVPWRWAVEAHNQALRAGCRKVSFGQYASR